MKRFILLTALFTFIAGTFAAIVRPPPTSTAIACARIARAAPASADFMTNSID